MVLAGQVLRRRGHLAKSAVLKALRIRFAPTLETLILTLITGNPALAAGLPKAVSRAFHKDVIHVSPNNRYFGATAALAFFLANI
ncbi:hypothetical protein GCM10010435_60190 [Winogradskya consettensis]|uniref:Uncharacterized protein n=1 Tax=Winogradskya consettensis TaxID=113560 RepID=A0A919ST30_9ACTN|nr:hypothetical protein [Actinoplanes consettensis]GIM76428.1 hypothetical protein Aco04nite_50370 [Actinoplanes consettensis]